MRKSRIGAWMTAVFLAAAMVLPVGTALAAEGDQPGILLGGEELEGKGVSKVYFGAHGKTPTSREPLYTRVLAQEGNHLVVLSEYVLDKVQFDSSSPYSNDWATSNAKRWCRNVYNGFTTEEKAAVPVTTISAEEGDYTVNEFTYKPCGVTREYLYFLSAEEAVNPDYGFETTGVKHKSREAYEKGTEKIFPWWLRSPYEYQNSIGAVYGNGTVNFNYVYNHWGGRPAFQINLDAVLFASPADGGKAGEIGTLGAVGTATSNDWKLTLKAASRKFAVTNPAAQTVNVGNTVRLEYTGAKTGSKEYVSAMLVDDSNQPVYYGRIKQVDGASEATGSMEIAIPESLPLGDYTLQVFNEQYNGDKETDVASVPSVVPLTVVRKPVEPKAEDGKLEGLLGTVTQGEKVTFTAQGAGMDNRTPVAGDERFRPKSWSVNPSGDFPNGEYTQSFETAGMKPGEHTLTITYVKEQYDGSAWVATDERKTQDFPFTLLAAPPQGGEEPPAPSATLATPTDEPGTPSDLTGGNPGTGDPLTVGWLIAAGVSALGAGVALRKQKKA